MGGGFDDVKEGIMTFSWLHHHVNGEVINNPDPMGSEVELVKRVSGAQLFLVDVEESVLMQCGEFSLRLLKQTHSPLAAVLASVGEVQWPVGKDAPILKVWNRRYTFALPGLVYGLSFPDSTPPAVLQQLESVMDQYCTFEIHQVAGTLAAGGWDDQALAYVENQLGMQQHDNYIISCKILYWMQQDYYCILLEF
jgi:hypothetical protein